MPPSSLATSSCHKQQSTTTATTTTEQYHSHSTIMQRGEPRPQHYRPYMPPPPPPHNRSLLDIASQAAATAVNRVPEHASAQSLTAVAPIIPVVPKPPIRECVVCCETRLDLIRPCTCSTDYCHDCLEDRFVMAVLDRTMFPGTASIALIPSIVRYMLTFAKVRCCGLVQLHTVLPRLSTEHAKEYRSRFEEWISRDKTYCPVPSCSSFISDRNVESAKPYGPTTLREFLHEILLKMSANSSSRFFREEPDITHLPGHASVVANPIHLTDMQAKLGQYTSPEELTQDVQLLLANAQLHGSDHPIAQAANELFNLYLHETSESIRQIFASRTSSFACPTCHVAICVECKKVEHRGHACDTSEHEQELAMLKKFGYKQCPRCKTGVRKMYGCSHM